VKIFQKEIYFKKRRGRKIRGPGTCIKKGRVRVQKGSDPSKKEKEGIGASPQTKRISKDLPSRGKKERRPNTEGPVRSDEGVRPGVGGGGGERLAAHGKGGLPAKKSGPAILSQRVDTKINILRKKRGKTQKRVTRDLQLQRPPYADHLHPEVH